MKNISVLTENIIHGLGDEEAEDYYFRLRSLGFSELEAERHALSLLGILRILRGILPIASLLHKNYREEVLNDLVSYITKRHEVYIRR